MKVRGTFFLFESLTYGLIFVKTSFMLFGYTVFMYSINKGIIMSHIMLDWKQCDIFRSPQTWAHLINTGGYDMNTAKSLAVAQYILDQRRVMGDAVTPMQLIKLVYIAQGYMLGKHGRPLLEEPVEAWQYGPVVPSVYHAIKHYRSSSVVAIPGAVPYTFTPEETETLNFVANNYGGHNGIVLSTATHQPGTPWHQTWCVMGKNAPISNDLIENFGMVQKPHVLVNSRRAEALPEMPWHEGAGNALGRGDRN